MAKKKKGLALAILLIIGAAAGFGVLDTAGVVMSLTLLIFAYLLFSGVKSGRLQEGFGVGGDEEDLSYEERIQQAQNNKEIIDILEEREREIFSNFIHLNPQNTIWDTYEIDRGEGESTKIRAYLVQDKETNQDMLFHIELGTGEIVRRSQRLEDMELYNLFENLQYKESIEKHKYNTSGKVMSELKKLMKQQNTQQQQGLVVDQDELPDKSEDGIIDADYREVD